MVQITRQSAKPAKKVVPSSRSKSGVVERISSMDFKDDDPIKMLLYGRSKTGKTTLLSSFPGPILSIICSGNNKTGELRSVDTPENRKKIKYVHLQNSSELREIIDYQMMENAFTTIALDHGSAFQDMVLAEVLGLSEVPAQKSWGLASQQQYGQCTLRCKELLKGLIGLDCNIVIIAQERDFDSDSESELIMPTIGAAMSPALVGWLNPACDYICNTFIKGKTTKKKIKVGGVEKEIVTKLPGVDYCLRVGPNEVYTTGFRIPKGRALPEFIVDPSYKKIIDLIQGR